MTDATDSIVKQAVLKAPQERVWQAISDPVRFGTWFGVDFDGPFAPGTRITGRIVPTKVDPEIARLQEPHAGIGFEIGIERLEPMRRLSFRWHPYAIEPGLDYSQEPTTLVEFELEADPDGTQLTITESGFEALPPDRRGEAYRSNEQGWEAQLSLIAKYLAQTT